MATQLGCRTIKLFTYRGAPEEWSNDYWFTGAPPNTDAEWHAMFMALAALEKTVVDPATSIVEFYGYNDNALNAHHAYHEDLRVTGTPVVGTLPGPGQVMAGDQAGIVWWLTERLTKRGKPIYLRKYFHAGMTDASQLDKISPSTGNAYANLSTALAPGGSWAYGPVTAQGQLDTIQAHSFSQWVTTRTLRRRGKRPLPKPATGSALS